MRISINLVYIKIDSMVSVDRQFHMKLEHAKPIILHTNGKPLLKAAPHIHIHSQSTTILLVVFGLQMVTVVLLLPRLLPGSMN